MAALTKAQIRQEIQLLQFQQQHANSIDAWVNQVQGEIWVKDDWSFKFAQATVTMAAGSSLLGALPTDLNMPVGLWRGDGTELDYLDTGDFNGITLGDTSTGLPTVWTHLGSQIKVAPTPASTDLACTLTYDREVQPLVDEGDTSLLPVSLQYGLLVLGGIVYGQKLLGDFTYQLAEPGHEAAIEALRDGYLAPQRGQNLQYGRDLEVWF